VLQPKECSLPRLQDTVSVPALVDILISQLGLGSVHHLVVELGLGDG